MKDYDYVTLFLPRDGQTERSPGSALISQDCVDWLNENVGTGTQVYREWMLAHDNDEMTWCYSGFEYDPETNYTSICRKFHFKDIQKATLFKLVWGG